MDAIVGKESMTISIPTGDEMNVSVILIVASDVRVLIDYYWCPDIWKNRRREAWVVECGRCGDIVP